MNARGIVLDVDGTIVRGGNPLPGAAQVVTTLREAGVSVVFVSNNPLRSRDDYCDRLRAMGFELEPCELVTSGTITGEILAREHPNDHVFVIGETGLIDQLGENDVSLTTDTDRSDVLVASIDRGFTYATFVDALEILSRGRVPFYGTDPDLTIPTETGVAPGSGAIINAVGGVVDRSPDRTFGKPSRAAIEIIDDAIDVALSECVIVGDRLDTDIELGRRAGMRTVLVRTGVTNGTELDRTVNGPDAIIDDIRSLPEILDRFDD